MGLGEGRGVVERDRIGRRVVQRRDEHRILGQARLVTGKSRADGGIVQDRAGDARIGFARMPAAGPAIETGGMGVVGAGGAVARQKDDPSEGRGERHARKDALCKRHAIVMRDARDIHRDAVGLIGGEPGSPDIHGRPG